MAPTFALFLSLTVSQPAADGPLVAHLTRGQELVYRGTFTEVARSATAPDRRAYDLEARTLVLDAGRGKAEVAFLTVLRASGAAPDAPGSARLELANVDARGRVTLQSTGAPPLVPLDGPPSLEPAGFVELPAGRIAGAWDVPDGLRPPREWRVADAEFRHGVRCRKLVAAQQSAEWDRPTGAAPAWRRTDVVWLAVQSGTVVRLERTVERRAGGDGSDGFRATTEYELTDDFTYPDRLAADRRQEIQQAAQLGQKLAALLPPAGHVGPPQQFAVLMDRIDRHVATQPTTPYRPAVLAVRRRAEAGLRGEAPPPDDAPEPPALPPTIGRPAPDFLTTDLIGGAPVRLARWRGRPAVLLFVHPDTPAAAVTLGLAADLQGRLGDRLRVAVLVIANEDRARPAWAEAGVPLLAGRDASLMYAVVGPSRVVVLDTDGVVRYLGDCGPGVLDAAQRVVSGN